MALQDDSNIAISSSVNIIELILSSVWKRIIIIYFERNTFIFFKAIFRLVEKDT